MASRRISACWATPRDARASRLLSPTATDVVLAIGQDFTSKSDEFHNDRTTASFCRAYRGAWGRKIRGATAPAITCGHSKDDHLPDLKQHFSTGNRTRATPCHEAREDLRSTTRTDPASVSLAERHQFLQEGKTVNTAHDFDWVIAMVMRRVVVREPKCLPDSAPRSPEGPLQANGPAGHPPRQQAPRPLELALSRT